MGYRVVAAHLNTHVHAQRVEDISILHASSNFYLVLLCYSVWLGIIGLMHYFKVPLGGGTNFQVQGAGGGGGAAYSACAGARCAGKLFWNTARQEYFCMLAGLFAMFGLAPTDFRLLLISF